MSEYENARPGEGSSFSFFDQSEEELYRCYRRFNELELEDALGGSLVQPEERERMVSEFAPESVEDFVRRFRAMPDTERAEYEAMLRMGYQQYCTALLAHARETVKQTVASIAEGHLPAGLSKLISDGKLPAEHAALLQRYLSPA